MNSKKIYTLTDDYYELFKTGKKFSDLELIILKNT
jgi:hypothetical protein